MENFIPIHSSFTVLFFILLLSGHQSSSASIKESKDAATKIVPHHPNDISVRHSKKKSNVDLLPIFLEDPIDSFVIKSRPAILNCSVIHSSKAYFTCNGEALAKSSEHVEKNLVDANGQVVRILSVEISREQVEEYFDVFKCHCDAWSSKGQASSKSATVATGYLNKVFEVPPYSQSVTLGKQVEIRCHPPKGKPRPRIYWMKNKMEIQVERDSNFLQSADGHLIIVQVRKQDMGNYTCVAENLINRRISPPARLDIFVDGGWSSWSPWTDCDVRCGKGFQRRQRVCNNPSPSLNGKYCEGDSEESHSCASLCQVDGSWSPWSSWSTCSPDCVHYKRRTCSDPEPRNGGLYCKGRDQASSLCTGGICRGNFEKDSPENTRTKDASSVVAADLALVIGLSVALIVFFCVTLLSIKIIRRKGRTQSIYNMASINYHEEFLDKDGSKRCETNFSFPGARIHTKAEDKQILKLDFPASTNNSPFPDKRLSKQTDKPFISDSISGPSSISPPTRCIPPKPDVVKSPTASEHQYDVPFSHLLPRKNRGEPTDKSYSDIVTGDRDVKSESSDEGETRATQGYTNHYLTSVVDGSGYTPLIKHSPWSVSDKSLNSSLGSDFSGLASTIPPSGLPSNRHSISSVVLPPGIDPDSFTFATVSHTGCKLSLPEWGVSLLVPPGALDSGYMEEVFLAVMREGRDQPTLSDKQTMLSPVVLAGPPRLSFKKPVVLSFNHCASLQQSNWEIGVYHCDSMFSEGKDNSWVKLITLDQETAACPIYTHLDFNTCFILSDFLSRFCLVGQSKPNLSASKSYKIVIFGQLVTSKVDIALSVYFIEDTEGTLATLVKWKEKCGAKLLENPKSFNLQDVGSDLCLKVLNCGQGWTVKPRKGLQEITFKSLWSTFDSRMFYTLELEQKDPSIKVINLDFTVFQKCQKQSSQIMKVQVDIKVLLYPNSHSDTSNCSSLVTSSSGCSSLSPHSTAFKLPAQVRQALCSALDKEQESGVDWRSLALGLRLARNMTFYSRRQSPTDCILSLWEAQQTDQAAITDLLNIVRIIGKPDVASRLEKEVGSWV
jgi:hypothetical protein